MLWYGMFYLILLIPVGIYYYFFGKRIFLLFRPTLSWKEKTFLGVLAGLIWILSCNIYGIWFVIFTHGLFFALLFDFFFFLCKKISGKKNNFLFFLHSSGILPFVCTFLVLLYAYFNMTNVTRRDYEVKTGKLVNPYQVVLLSDLHFGTTMDLDTLRHYAKEIAEISPSFVVLAGDITDEHTSLEEMQSALKILGEIPTRYGVFYIYGNHDQSRYYGNRNYTTQELENALSNANITPLVDEAILVNDEIYVIGRDDLSFPHHGSERKDSKELAEGLDQNKFWLIVDHYPGDWEENARSGYDLQLSGHTHGGQMFPTGLFTEWFDHDLVNYGKKEIGDFSIIVSSGMGGWDYPFRTGHHSEYVVVSLLPS